MARPNRKVPNSIRRNLLDQQFGEWTVIGFVGGSSRGTVWLCRCSCGCIKEMTAGHLTSGNSTRCNSCSPFRSHKHGYDGTPTYRSWKRVKNSGRCVARWRNFLAFLEDMGERPENSRLWRQDRSKRFGPSNCYWSSQKPEIPKSEANKLRKTTNFAARRKLIEQLRKKRYSFQQIADAAGVTRQAIHGMLTRPLPKYVTGEPHRKVVVSEKLQRVREQIKQHYKRGLKAREIADAINIPPTTVCYNIQRLIGLRQIPPRRPRIRTRDK